MLVFFITVTIGIFKDSVGFGKNYNKYGSLDYVTTYLENYPKKGEKSS